MPSADILYFYGEDTNITALFRTASPGIPPGYNFDFVNADALIHKFIVRDGRIVSRSGASYRALVLDKNASDISLPVLRAIERLIDTGGVVIGERPVRTQSLSDDPAQFDAIVARLWKNGGIGSYEKTVHSTQLSDTLSGLSISPDLSLKDSPLPSDMLFNHRSLSEGKIYFISNRTKTARQLTFSFRASGYAPEIWHADTGSAEPATYTTSNGRTEIPVSLDGDESLFVVFRAKTAERTRTVPLSREAVLQSLKDDWSLTFEPDRGAPVWPNLVRKTDQKPCRDY
jgi:hypothetical protein